MAVNTKVSMAVAIDQCDAAVDRVDIGSGTAKLRIYDGTQPAGPGTAISSQVLLAEFDLPNPAYDNAADQTTYAEAALLGTPLTDSSANNTGTASWFRVINRNGDAVFDGNVGMGGTYDLVLDNTSIVSGQTVKINSGAFRQPIA